MKEEKLEKPVVKRRKIYRYSPPDELRKRILVERSVSDWEYLIVIDTKLSGLVAARIVERIATKHGLRAAIYEAKPVLLTEGYIDEKIRENMDGIPPHIVYEVRKALLEGKLPRGEKRKELLKTLSLF